ncbi:murein L,D-transpeptidase catalytic domain-containing protein [Puia sp. P3]|uniref:murein L,D-transpeptidase catalytic domain-containing protein n=1 Tax=Puia sp. P3 TaxID=3423952 RepID=UPI003D67677E
MRWLRRVGLAVGISIIVTLGVAGRIYYRDGWGDLANWHRRMVWSSGMRGGTAAAGAGAARAGAAGAGAASAAANDERQRLVAEAAVLKSYLRGHRVNGEFCFLVDMGLPSGMYRFFVYDLRKDSILLAGLVAHGAGSANFSATPSFSNTNGSGCTSLGRYRIGYPYNGMCGRSYKLYGLDTTNNQAFQRNVVLHSWKDVPDAETYPYPICNSRGCPMVSPAFLHQLQPMIDRSKKPVLLCIFN